MFGVAAVLGPCAQPAVDIMAEDAEDGFVVENGKADDFLSLKAREFVLTGTARVVVEEGRTINRARNLLHHKHTAITWFLNQYLVNKETGLDMR